MYAALALALLATPPDFPDSPPPADEFDAIAAAIQQLAVETEILDPRESRYVMANLIDWDNDLAMLRRRNAELRDAPRLADAERFPDRGTCNELLAFNRSYRRYVDRMAAMNTDRPGVIKATLRECDKLYECWDAVRDAKSEYYYVTVKRQGLKRLRDTVGAEAYAAGEMPPAWPHWRFVEAHATVH